MSGSLRKAGGYAKLAGLGGKAYDVQWKDFQTVDTECAAHGGFACRGTSRSRQWREACAPRSQRSDRQLPGGWSVTIG